MTGKRPEAAPQGINCWQAAVDHKADFDAVLNKEQLLTRIDRQAASPFR